MALADAAVDDAGRRRVLADLNRRTMLPNTFVIGAPRSGTTSLYEYLNATLRCT